MSLVVIKPISVTETVLRSSSLAEDTNAEWTAGATFGAGDLCYVASAHRVYISTEAANVGNNPLTSPAKWINMRATNKWAMFDGAIGATSTDPTEIVVTLRPGAASALAFLGLVGAISITVTMTDSPGGSTVLDQTYDLSSVLIGDAYEYVTAPFEYRSEYVVRDLPMYASGELTITISGNGTDPVECGELIVGTAYSFGKPLQGLKLSSIDYSTIETDDYGVTSIVERQYVRKLSLQFVVEQPQLNRTFAVLNSFRATPCVYVPSAKSDHDALIVYGIAREPEIDLSSPYFYFCSLQIRGV